MEAVTGRLIVHYPATGERRVIPATQLALEMFLAASDGSTLTIGRLALCGGDVELARQASPSERVRPVRPGGSLRSHQPAEPGPAPLPKREETP